MPPEAVNGIMNVTDTRAAPRLRGTGSATSHCDVEVNQVATVNELTSGAYRVTVTGTELALLRNALDEAERVSRFGIEVLDEAEKSTDGEPAPSSRLLSEIDALAMREASLRSVQKTMAETGGGKLAPAR
jgi:hypothetical protein